MKAIARQAILLASAAVLALPAIVQAQFILSTNNGQITIVRYTGSGGDITIPSMTNGLPVSSIGGEAFSYCYRLTNVSIPSSVTKIGSGAFLGCTSLTGIAVNASNPVYSSEGGVLFDKSQTTLIEYPRGKTESSYAIIASVTSIRPWAFRDCLRLTSVTIPSGVTNIGGGAFSGTRLANITIPNSVTSIGSWAFEGCTSLTGIAVNASNPTYSSVGGVLFDKSQTTLIEYPRGKAGSYTIPNSVTTIGWFAFRGCTNLTSVAIPTSVTNLVAPVFCECPNLTAITVDAGNPVYSSLDGVLLNKSQTMLIQYPGGKPGDYTIPSCVTRIGGGAFSDCTCLTSVTIPSSVTSIGDSAFSSCTSLTNVSIPSSVTSIGSVVFGGCNLTSVTIPDSVTNIGIAAFCGCTSLTGVIIPCGVTNIEKWAFVQCPSLTSVCFKGNAPRLGDRVFLKSDKATLYYLPGTTGWGTNFGRRPTAIWKPETKAPTAGGLQ